VDYHTVAGKLSQEAADHIGLPSGIPLIAGAGDKIAGCIGCGILKPGDTVFEASSYGAVSVLAEGYVPNPERHDYDAIPAAEAGCYYLHKYLPGSGITLRWFLDTFGKDLKGDDFGSVERGSGGCSAESDGLMAVGLLGGSAMPLTATSGGRGSGHVEPYNGHISTGRF
jgi:xylulokinase